MTAEEFVQLLDETEWMGHELVRGDAVQVGEPWVELKHARRRARLVHIFWNFEVTNRIAFFDASHFYALARNPDTVRSVDISAIRYDRLPGDYDDTETCAVAPDFAIHVRSSTDRADTLPAKIHDFLTAGTKQFWLLDEDERTVTIHTADAQPRIVRGSEPLTADPVLPGISCTLDQLFS